MDSGVLGVVVLGYDVVINVVVFMDVDVVESDVEIVFVVNFCGVELFVSVVYQVWVCFVQLLIDYVFYGDGN